MYVKIVDGVAVFATQLIRCDVEATKESLPRLQLRQEGIVIYPDDDIAEIEVILQEQKIPYTIEAQDFTEHKTKAEGIKYASRTECINHLLNDNEPESQIIPNLKRKHKEKEAQIQALNEKVKEREIKAKMFMDEAANKDQKIKELEDRLAKIEEMLAKKGI